MPPSIVENRIREPSSWHLFVSFFEVESSGFAVTCWLGQWRCSDLGFGATVGQLL